MERKNCGQMKESGTASAIAVHFYGKAQILFHAKHIDCSICKQAAILTFDLDTDDDDGPASAEGRSTGVYGSLGQILDKIDVSALGHIIAAIAAGGQAGYTVGKREQQAAVDKTMGVFVGGGDGHFYFTVVMLGADGFNAAKIHKRIALAIGGQVGIVHRENSFYFFGRLLATGSASCRRYLDTVRCAS